MSKSLGNVLAIPGCAATGSPAELRYYLGSAHHRSMLEFSEKALQDAVKAYTGPRSSCTGYAPGSAPSRSATWTDWFGPRSTTTMAVPAAPAEVHTARADGNRAWMPATTMALWPGRPRSGPRWASRLRPARRALGVPRRDVLGPWPPSTC